jgi:hypothetical protein
MRGVVFDPEHLVQHAGYSGPRPAVPAEAPGFGAQRQQLGNLGLLGCIQARQLPRRLPVAQSRRTRLLGLFEPLAHRPRTHAQCLRDPTLRPTLLAQFPGPQAAAFPPVGRFLITSTHHGPVLPRAANL